MGELQIDLAPLLGPHEKITLVVTWWSEKGVVSQLAKLRVQLISFPQKDRTTPTKA